MTIQWGDTGRVAVGTLKSYSITLATPQEQLLTAGTTPALFTLPTTQPGSPQITLTIGSSDLPTITPLPPTTPTYMAMLYVGGSNQTGASGGASYVVYKNGATAQTGSISSVSNSNYWTQNMYGFFNVKSGDVFTIYLYGSTALTCDYYGMQVYPTQMALSNKTNTILENVSFTVSTPPSLTKGNPSVQGNGNGVYTFPYNTTSLNALSTTSFSLGAATFNTSKNSFALHFGDMNQGAFTSTSTTYRPYYFRDYIPSLITFREVLR